MSESDLADIKIPSLPLVFDRITLCAGDARWDYPLGRPEAAEPVRGIEHYRGSELARQMLQGAIDETAEHLLEEARVGWDATVQQPSQPAQLTREQTEDDDRGAINVNRDPASWDDTEKQVFQEGESVVIDLSRDPAWTCEVLRRGGVNYLLWDRRQCVCERCQRNDGNIVAIGTPFPSGDIVTGIGGCTGTVKCYSNISSPEKIYGSAKIAEAMTNLDQWMNRALEDVREGRAQRGFCTTVIPEKLHKAIHVLLDHAQSEDQVLATFAWVERRVSETETLPPQITWEPDDINSRLHDYAQQGIQELTWECGRYACDLCIANDGETRKLGETFPNGARLPQCHNHCQCRVYPPAWNPQQRAAFIRDQDREFEARMEHGHIMVDAVSPSDVEPLGAPADLAPFEETSGDADTGAGESAPGSPAIRGDEAIQPISPDTSQATIPSDGVLLDVQPEDEL